MSKKRKRADSEPKEAHLIKKRRPTAIDAAALGGPSDFRDSTAHPLGVEPLGNIYLRVGGDFTNIRDAGLGSFSVLIDDLVLLFLQYPSSLS